MGSLLAFRVVDGFGRGVCDFMILDGDPHLFERETAPYVLVVPDSLPEGTLGQPVHVAFQLLLKGKAVVRYVPITVSWDV